MPLKSLVFHSARYCPFSGLLTAEMIDLSCGLTSVTQVSETLGRRFAHYVYNYQ